MFMYVIHSVISLGHHFPYWHEVSVLQTPQSGVLWICINMCEGQEDISSWALDKHHYFMYEFWVSDFPETR